MEWGGKNAGDWHPQNRTDAAKSYLTLWDIRPAGQFSRFEIQSVTRGNLDKTIGGDSWRVHIRGPSSMSPTVFDHSNGKYEVVFLVLEPGKYDVEVVLEYSLCNGYKDPPRDWFIKGNAQGRYQAPNALPGHDRPFLLSPLWDGAPFTIIIPHSSELLFQKVISKFGSLNVPCGIKCSEMWDGNGRWVNETWIPYLTEESQRRKQSSPAEKLGTMWIYGDSVGDFFYKSIVKQPLCKKLFLRCNNTYNWVYTIPGRNLTRGRLENDDNDFSIRRVLTEIFRVISQPFMDNDKSVLILNLGLHYVHTINFTTYKVLIDKTIRLLNERFKTANKKSWRFRGKVIWKTTTAINKEKYGDPRTNARHSTSIRFLTYQRVLLFNAYAMHAMCRAGIDVLDVFLISDSYPEGTGLPRKPYDAVHFKPHVFQSVVNLLQRYFSYQESH
ncbi:hypothetical protein OS493_035279 [Desmophyllum pertusum]|uniref:Uncharacterized protein n=1 Tax=Desmophyllum pertusum TaxID=174260 RepID=A0A9W9YV13_9CNID|nr:hypothetical protein OS493_035279 [Desmophyllum pertusum]